jgi:hypothetical protein
VGNIDDLAEIIYTCMIEYENKHIKDIPERNNESEVFPCSHNENILDVSLYTLNLLPERLLPVVLYISDGVSSDFGSMDLHDTKRSFLRNYIHFCVLHVGSSMGFTPTSNFGFIPNQEDLRYLSEALGGVFVYAEDCDYLEDNDSTDQPNMYHQMLAFKTVKFSNQVVEPMESEARSVDIVQTKIISTGIETALKISSQEMNFPWKYNSRPPSIAEILCSYRSYKIPRLELEKLIRVRVNEGFSILKVVKSSAKTNVKVEIVMSFIFAPNVTVLYSIKFNWLLDEKQLSKFVPQKSIRVEINVLAHHPFAVLFINVHNIDPSKGGNQVGNGLYEKLGQLHELLKSITESDETLQILGQFNSPSALLLAKKISGEVDRQTESLDLPSNYWQYLNQVLLIKESLLDNWSCSLMLRSTSSQGNLGLRAAQIIMGRQEMNRAGYQVATIYLSKFLNAWGSFSLSKTTYIRWVGLGTGLQPVGFCLIQITWETESLMNVSLRFYGCELEEQRSIIREFHEGVHSIRHTLRNTTSMIEPLILCAKPANSLMVGYTPIFDTFSDFENFRNHPDPRNLLFIANASLSRQILRNKSWVWFSDIKCRSAEILSGLIEMAFVLLYNSRNHEGFLRISESSGCISFYKEYQYDSDDLFVVQYVILWSPTTNFLMTEVWIEPVRGSNPKEMNFYDRMQQDIFENDLRLLNRLLVLEFLRNKDMFTQEPQISHSSTSLVFVETNIFLGPLLENSRLVYTPFKCLHYENGLHESFVIDSGTKPISYIRQELIGTGVRLDDISAKDNQIYVCDCCQLLISDLKEDSGLNMNTILYGFFLSSLQVLRILFLLASGEPFRNNT